MAVRIYAKYRCLTCEGTPTIGDDGAAMEHLTANIGHELAMRTTSEFVEDEPEVEE